MWKWMIAALLLAVPAQARDLQKEHDRADKITTSICEIEGRAKDYECVLSYVVFAQIMACVTLYERDATARLECFDDRAGTLHNAYRKVLKYQ